MRLETTHEYFCNRLMDKRVKNITETILLYLINQATIILKEINGYLCFYQYKHNTKLTVFEIWIPETYAPPCINYNKFVKLKGKNDFKIIRNNLRSQNHL